MTNILKKNPIAKNYKHLHQVANIQNLPNYKMIFLRKDGQQKHVYNKPLTAECGAIIVSDSGLPENYDLCVYPKELPENHPPDTYLNKLSQFVDPMVFPLLFPLGDLGWSTNYLQNYQLKEKKNLTLLQYYLYRLAYRPNIKNFSPLLYAGRLTQQFFIHAYVMIENNRLNYLRNNQNTLRIECYQGLLDAVVNSASNISNNFEKKEKVGNLFILPSTYIGSPRYMQQHYQDAMAIMRKCGRPDLFITVTCNPKWKELKLILKQFPKNTNANDIPHITVRLFHTKLKSIMNDITQKKIFGKVLAYVYTVEFQKRGIPHSHILVTLHPENKIITSEQIDKYISAEIISNNEKLKKLTIKHMLHGPHNKQSPCLHNENKCIKKFPKPFADVTFIQKNGYPEYKRTDNTSDNHFYKTAYNEKIPVDNSMVVPYNKFLLMKYKCHINVEFCASIQSIKYIFKYLPST